MAAIARRWIRSFCEECGDVTEFEVDARWVFVCQVCASERRLSPNGLLPLTPPRVLVA